MALQPVRIPTFNQAVPVTDDQGRFTSAALRSLNDSFKALALAVNATTEAINAANLAQTAADNAASAAAAAQTAADNAQATGGAVSRETAIQNSYIVPDMVITSTPTLITIASHTRYYGDGTSATVNGGTLSPTAAGDTDYVYYDQASRAGGTVTYVASTTAPVQSGDRHVVGAVSVPTIGTANGGRGPRQPGYVTATP